MSFDYTLPRRSGTYRFVRVDRDTWMEAEELDNVVSGSGSVMRIQNNALKEQGVLSVVGPLGIGDDLLRIYYEATDSAGETLSTPIATLFASKGKSKYTSAAEQGSVTMYSALLALKRKVITETMTIAAGAVAIDEAEDLLDEVGMQHAITASTKQLNVGKSWKPGTSYLDIINDLCQFAGYWAARPDPAGRVKLFPYASPRERTAVYDFEEGPSSIFLPDMGYESDAYDVPNIFVVNSTNATETFSGSYENSDPESPYSTANRPEIPTVREVNDADDADDCASMAERDAQTHPGPADTYTVQHAYRPLTISDVVNVIWPARDINIKGAIQSQTLTLNRALMVTSAVKRVWA